MYKSAMICFCSLFRISGTGLPRFTIARKGLCWVVGQTIPTSLNYYPTIPNFTIERPAWKLRKLLVLAADLSFLLKGVLCFYLQDS